MSSAPAGMPATAEDLKIAVQDLGCVIASSRDEKYKQSLRDLQDRLAESARLLEAPVDEQLEELLTALTGFSGDDFTTRTTVSHVDFIKARDRIRQLFALRSSPRVKAMAEGIADLRAENEKQRNQLQEIADKVEDYINPNFPDDIVSAVSLAVDALDYEIDQAKEILTEGLDRDRDPKDGICQLATVAVNGIANRDAEISRLRSENERLQKDNGQMRSGIIEARAIFENGTDYEKKHIGNILYEAIPRRSLSEPAGTENGK